MLQQEIKKIVKAALIEDKAWLDTTSDSTIKKNDEISFSISPRENIIFCGKDIVSEVFKTLKNYKKFKNARIFIKNSTKDGKFVKKGQKIIFGTGNARLIFAGERVILNLIQHLSGISTLTNQLVEKLNNKNIKILDTRKTIPNLRYLQKYAVKMGGGLNHRFNLSDLILIKDNHIAAAKSVDNAIKKAKKTGKKIEIECDNLTQVKEAVKHNPDIIMLDNMNAKEVEKCTKIIRENSKIKIEISGQINLKNIKNYSKSDIDFISIGSLTHSVKSADIGLDIK